LQVQLYDPLPAESHVPSFLQGLLLHSGTTGLTTQSKHRTNVRAN